METAPRGRRGTAAGGARCVEAKYEWRAPNRILVVEVGTNEDEAKVFRAHAVATRGMCKILPTRSCC